MVEQLRNRTKAKSYLNIDMNKFNLLIFYLFPLIDVKLYGFAFINPQIMKAVLFVAIPLLFLYCFNTIYKHKDKFSLDIRYILMSLSFSMVMALFFHDQSLLLSYRSTCNLFSFIFYFFLLKTRIPEKHILRCILFYCILWILVWGIALYYAPIPIFGNIDEELYEIRGTYRFFIPGDAFLYLIFYYCVAKCVINKKKIFIIFSVLLGVVIIYQVTRQTIVTCIIITMYYILRKVKYIIVYLSVILFVSTFFTINIADKTVIGNMINLSEEQIDAQRKGEIDTRLLDYKYFLTEFENNPVTVFLGNGMPHDDSNYGKIFLKLKEDRFIYLSDVGYPSIYIISGILGLILFGRLFYHIAKFKYISKDMIWIKMYLMHVMICNFASFHIATNMVGISLALYLFTKRRQYVRYVHNKMYQRKISKLKKSDKISNKEQILIAE